MTKSSERRAERVDGVPIRGRQGFDGGEEIATSVQEGRRTPQRAGTLNANDNGIDYSATDKVAA